MSANKENKEIHLLIENSVNKDILFIEEGLRPFLFHTHLIKMFKLDNFNFDKMFKLSPEYEFNNIREKLRDFRKKSSEWKNFKEGNKDTDMITILRKYLDKRFTIFNILEFLSQIASVPIPFLVKRLLEFFSSKEVNSKKGLIYAFSIIGLLLLTKILSHASFHGQIYTQLMSKYLGIVRILP